MSNSLENPDVIKVSQPLTISSSIVDSIEGNIDMKLDFAANELSPHPKVENKKSPPAMKI